MGARLGRDTSGDISMDEVAKHVSKDDAWLVLFGEAIDVTRFLPLHPGGEDMINAYLGKDATADWQEIHRPEHLHKHWGTLDKKGRIEVQGGLLAWLFSSTRDQSSMLTAPEAKPKKPAGDEDFSGLDVEEEEEEATEEVEALRWTVEHEGELPPGGSFDLQELARWDGVQLPMCIGVCGLVLDVSSSSNFVPNFGYGKLWAGRDTTWAMATVSLKAHDANKFDFKIADLGEDQAKALAGWYKHFTTKYRTVGRLKELKDWDFSSVEECAAQLPASSMSAA